MNEPDILRTLGPAVAKHLPDWHYCRTDRGDFLIPKGVPASTYSPWRNHCQGIGLDADNGRVIVHGHWPHGRADSGWRACGPSDIREESPTITVSARRPPEKIAAEITRRFLPEYQRIYVLLDQYLTAQVNGEQRQREVTAEFAEIMGDRPHKQRPAHASWFGEDCYGHVDINHGGETGTLELRGNVDILKAALIAAGKAGAFRKDK